MGEAASRYAGRGVANVYTGEEARSYSSGPFLPWVRRGRRRHPDRRDPAYWPAGDRG